MKSSMKKRMPYGNANFKRVATQNYYYVDKTQYIEKLEEVEYPVFLRPRRFGKSLFTEMLRWYYDLKAKDLFQNIFGNLYIGKNPTPNRNKFFVLTFDFSGMDTFIEDDQNHLKKGFYTNIVDSFKSFLTYYKEEFSIDEAFIEKFYTTYVSNAVSGLFEIFRLCNSAGLKLYIIIDEYDSLTNSLAIRYHHSEIKDDVYSTILQRGGFFRSFFEALKSGTKTSINQIFITGILPITISDMKSGFNIATWITFNPKFTNMLGITQNEFESLIDKIYTDHSLSLDKVQLKQTITQYYNGYRFRTGGEKVYNPMMTLYFLNYVIDFDQYPTQLTDKNIRIDYKQIAFLFGENKTKRDETIEILSCNKEIRYSATLDVSFDMLDYKKGKYITEGLFYSGILTYGSTSSRLVIPNIITYDFAQEYFEQIKEFEPRTDYISNWIVDYLETKDAEKLIAGFFTDIIQAFPGNFFANVNESFYHGLFFHVVFNNTTKDVYEVLPEFNLPNGAADLYVRTFPQAKVPVVLNDLFEIKRVPKSAKEVKFEAKFNEGKAQMQEYLTGAYQNWRGIVVCFRGNKDYRMEIFN